MRLWPLLSPLVRLKRFFIEGDIPRVITEPQLRGVQVALLSELDPESLALALTSSLLLTDPLPQLAVGHSEAPVQVLGGHLVLVIESHSVGGK